MFIYVRNTEIHKFRHVTTCHLFATMNAFFLHLLLQPRTRLSRSDFAIKAALCGEDVDPVSRDTCTRLAI